ncbi:glycoside hydrolase family 95 protein [bacterium]|nr:glycoside hydrolase family 95 protein [bacterium]
MKKFSLFLSLMCCFCLYAWAGEASLKAAPAAAPIVEHVNGVKAVSADFVPGTVVTDAASISEGMGYVIRSVRGFVLYSADYPNHIAGSAGSGVTDEGTAAYDVAAQQFQFKTNGSNTYLYSVGAGKYVKSDGSYEDTPSSPVTFVATGNAEYPLCIKVGNNTLNMQGSGGYPQGCIVDGWSTLDDGNRLAIIEAVVLDDLAAYRTQYKALVQKINDAKKLQFFYHSTAEAEAAIPATMPGTAEELQDAIAAMQDALTAMESSPVLGTDIADRPLYLGNLLHTSMFVGLTDGKLGSNVAKYDKDHVWYFENASANNTYYMKNLATGLYVAALPEALNTRVELVEKENAGVYTVEYAGVNGYCNIYDANGADEYNALHMVNWDGVVRWVPDADASKFLFQDASELLPALEKTYRIQNKKGAYVSVDDSYVDSNGNLKLTNGSEPGNFDGLWHVMRTSDGLYRFINAGESKKGLVMMITGSEADARTTMTAPAVADGNDGSYFNGTVNLDGSASYIKIASSANNYWNKRGDYLALWNSGAAVGDDGSTFYITEVIPTEEMLYAEFNTVEPGQRPADINDFSLWYNVPVAHTGVSDTWMEYALPLGNGQVGTTIRGGLYKDEIQFNEKTLWAGTTANSNQGYFQNFGSIKVVDKSGNFSLADDTKPVKEYVRYLDIVDGVGGVNYKSSDEATSYKRRYFTSATDRVFVAHYEAEGTDKLTLKFTYVPDKLINAGAVSYAEGAAQFGGKLNIVTYNTAFKVLANEGATVTTDEEGIHVEGADWVNLIMAAATDYDATKAGCVSGETAEQIAAKVQERIDAAAAKNYAELLAAHVAKHSELMNRVELTLGTVSEKTTEDLIKFYNEAAGNKTSPEGLFLESLYFQYGRYMTIGANLDTSIHAPSNLQGIWNDRSNTSFWHCDVHADINVEMNYWPADPTNLSEMHRPFLDHIIDLAAAPNSPWAALATKIAGKAGGWAVAVENNIFGGTSTWCNQSIKTCGAWYVTHLWRHYKYTLDRDFLKKALPVMYDYALFTKNISTLDGNGKYEIKNEWSPEHGPGDVTAFAQQTSYEALDEVFKAHAELGDESPLTAEQLAAIQDLYDNFDKGLWTETYDGKTMISEWKNNPLQDQGHRHLSHLMCLYPFSMVSAFDTTDEGQTLFQAAYNGQIARNGDVTGWSMGWQTNTYARCLDGDNARRNLTLALRHSTNYAIAMGGDGGCYYNLFDAHSPFQIDGNYGCTSGVAEMLLQSYDDVITILPALPTAWANGSVKGLKAQGDYCVDITWADGTANAVSITNNKEMERTVSVRLGGEVKDFTIEAYGTLVLDLEEGKFPTGIQVIQNGVSKQKAMYDLSGRRVNKLQQGVYIVDGKKMIY